MILKALYDYYHSLPKSAPSGTELKEIEFVIVIDRDGSFRRFESKRIDKKRCASFYVAKAVYPVPQALKAIYFGTTASMCSDWKRHTSNTIAFL